MSDIAISVENLSKKFRIGTANSPGYHRLSEALTGVPRMAWNSLFSARSASEPTALAAGSSPQSHASSLQPANEFWALKDVSFSASDPTALAAGSSLQSQASRLQPANEFWALKDVSFEVKQGEVVGIIGRNGAGKSTLLKILSRISEPTSGRFGIRGRVASLLEVGTGFHPELTGRENIFVSGITLGMTRAEIKKRFDEIVDFSGVEKFLDTPVKHYSSGMQVRLGFAVAAHLESEVLIVDEVLAVGDAEFQSKCIGKMDSVSKGGRTIILVSHDMRAISRLCSQAILLQLGAVEVKSNASQVCSQYSQGNTSASLSSTIWSQIASLPSDETIRVLDLRLRQSEVLFDSEIDITRPLIIEVDVEILENAAEFRIYIDLVSDNGDLLFRSFDCDDFPAPRNWRRGYHCCRITLPQSILATRWYSLQIQAGFFEGRYCLGSGINIPIHGNDAMLPLTPFPTEPIRGQLLAPLQWEVLDA